MTNLRGVFFWYCMVFCMVGLAQTRLPKQLKFNTLKIEDGLTNNIINDVVQDSVGFIWIATNDGLSRYDGGKFVNFTESLSGENSISNNYVQSLKVDSSGDLWIATDNGLNVYNSKTNSFKQIPSYTPKGISHHSISAFEEGRNKQFFVGTYGGGLDVLKDGEVIENFNESNSNIGSNLISSIQYKSDEEIWVTTWYNGLYKLDLTDKTISAVVLREVDSAMNLDIRASRIDAEGVLYLATNQGLYIVKNQEEHFLVNQVSNTSLSDEDILSLFIDSRDVFWMGTRNKGFMQIQKSELLENPYNVAFERFEPNNSDQSVSYRSVSCFYEDTQNNVWIGTHNEGVNIVNPIGEVILGINNLSEVESTSDNTSVWGLLEDDNDNIWLGTDGNGLIKVNPTNGASIRYIHNESDNNSLSDDAILCASKDTLGNLWFGTYSGGLNKFDPKTNKFKRYQQGSKSNELNRNDIRALFTGADGNLWIGTNGGGLQLYRSETDDFLFIDVVGWLDVRCITEDKNGVLWLGTFGNGVLSYNPKTNEVENFAVFEDLNASIIFSLAFSAENDLWIGTRYKGLLHYNTETKQVLQYSNSDGLSNNTIHAIVPTSEEEIWLSTNNGINVFNNTTERFKTFQRAHGVLSGSFNNNSGIISENGYIIFGGTTGVNLFYPKDLIQEDKKLKLVLTDLKLFNVSLPVDRTKDGLLNQSIFFEDEVKFKYNQDVISIDYAALNYPKATGIKFAYILENYEDNWNEVGSETTATYRNLSPGDYVFKVKVSDEEGYMSSDTRALKIIVAPHVLLTWPAILIYVILITLAVFGVAKYYLHQVKLENTLYFEKKLRAQETDLNKERFRFFTNFSHELRTPLTLIFGPISDLLQKEKNAERKSRLQIVHRNAEILLELINKMLEFRKTETEHNHLEVGIYDIQDFVNKITSNFEFYAAQKEIDFKIDNPKKILLLFDYKKIQNVIINLLSNAFKYTDKGGSVVVKVEEVGDRVFIHFEDTGRGIHPESLKAVFDLYYHKDFMETIEGTGIGLALCKKLMDLHKGAITVESIQGEGSIFTIELFKDREHYDGMENVEFLEASKFRIKKPFINDPVLGGSQTKEIAIDKDDKIVLVVDDNPDILNYISEILSDKFKVVTAENGKEGIEKAKELIPDMIISDVMMPVKSGIDLCVTLKNFELTSHIPIILLTAKLGEKDKLQGMKIGAEDYITKPFYSDYLITRINNIFSNRKKLIDHFNEVSDVIEVIPKEKSNDELFLDKVEGVLLLNYDKEDFSVNELATELGVSRSSLYRKIKAITGLSINHFIRKVLLKKAGEMLRSGNYNVSEVAFELGFNDLAKFRKYFKEEYGVVPSSYKSENQSYQ